MELSNRQHRIIEIVKNGEPISGGDIAKKLGLTKSTLRSDLAVLTMTGILDAKPKVGYYYSGLPDAPLIQNEITHTQAGEIMVPPVIISPDLTIKDAITHLFMYDSGSLYVVGENRELIGIVSRKDLLRSAIIGGEGDGAVAIMMTRMPNIYRITKETLAIDAAKLISRHQIDSLPVMKSKDSLEIIGKVSKTTLVNFFIEKNEKNISY